MLPTHARLRRSTDFASTVRRGSRGATPTVVVHLSATANSPAPPRVGFIVSRALGPAVVRNKVRRRLRHLVRELWADLPPGTRLVVRATPAAATAEYERLGVDLRRGVEMASAG